MAIVELARAKINLTLTVLGRRADGYHALESLVTFADLGDRLTFAPGEAPGVALAGPFAAAITGENLVTRALGLLGALDPALILGAVTLEKNLPVAAGLGGGSADAAALLRAVRRTDPASALDWSTAAASLGADVPVCLGDAPALMWGTGEKLIELPRGNRQPSPIAAVLVNPLRPLSTAAVFARLGADCAPAALQAPMRPPLFADLGALVEYVRARGNDLEHPAVALEPGIGRVLAALGAQPGCRYAAMSGSGATCFALFDSSAQSATAAATLAQAEPGWWVAPTGLDWPG
jgi:4-diphosphocytidyl-2-C-methyl-D-erythritol kinase